MIVFNVRRFNYGEGTESYARLHCVLISIFIVIALSASSVDTASAELPIDTYSDLGVCSVATDRWNRIWDSSTEVTESYVVEAKRRGLSIDNCLTILGYAASDTQIATETGRQITIEDSSRDEVEKYSLVENLRTMDLILLFLVGFSVFISLILIIILLILLRRFPSSKLSRVESNSSDTDDALEIDLSKSDTVGPKNIENSGETATDSRVVADKGNPTKPENESQFVQTAALPKLEQMDKIIPTQPTEEELAKRDAKRRQQQREFRLNIGRSWKKSDK